jgi:hypothetical protein
VHSLDGTTAAKFDSVAIVDFFKSVYDGELHDIKPTHSTYKTFKAACLGLMNYDCYEKKLDPLPDGLFTATAALKQVSQWQKLLEHESNRKNVSDQVTGAYAIDLHAGIKASIWDHAQRAHAEMVAMDTGQVKFNSERTKLQTRAIWRMSCVSGLRISDAAAVYWHHFFTRRVEHYGPDGAAVMNFITHNGKTNFGRNLQWSGMFQHRNSRLCAIVAGGEVLVHQLCIENDKFPDFSNPEEFRNLPILTPESARPTPGMSQNTAAPTIASGAAMMAKRIQTMHTFVDGGDVISQSLSRKKTHAARNAAYHTLTENGISNGQQNVMMRHGDDPTAFYAYGDKFSPPAGQALACLGVYPTRCETPHGVDATRIRHPNGDEQDSEGTRRTEHALTDLISSTKGCRGRMRAM